MSDLNPTRTVLIGCGSMGKNHFRLLNEIPGFDLVAVVDPNKSVQELCGETPFYTHYSQIDKTSFEAVVVASPINLHYEQGLEILGDGKHLLMEKPLAQTSQQAQTLMELAKKSGLMLLTGHVERFNPAFRIFCAELEKRDLGRIFRYEFHRIGPYPSNPGNFGVTEDLAVHDLDLFYQLEQRECAKLFVHRTKQFHPDHEDGLMAHLELKNGATALFNVNWLSPRKQRFVRIYGEHGMLECNLFERKVFFYESKLRRQRPDEFGIQGIEYGATVEIDVPQGEPLRGELEFFLDLCTGKETLSDEIQQGPVYAIEMVERFLSE